MDVSLSEAARLLGKSDRQVRYLIREGKLPARKEKGRWRIRREDLPLNEGQARAQQQKTARAARLAEEILRPNAEGAKKDFSVRQIRACQVGMDLYHHLEEKAGAQHQATQLLREALMLLSCGYHEFESGHKAEMYSRARQHASRAAMALLLEKDESWVDLAERLESVLLPALGGLIQSAERRGRRR